MILDYLRHSKDGSIRIPPFHTGHLGFIPPTDVSVCLMVPYDQPESHCELYVSPFPANIETLCRLYCMMKDRPGVVNRLIEAVAALKINIVKKESSGINYLNQHFVEMVLDWRTSPHKQFLETPAEVVSRYDRLKYRIPIIDYRYVRLYEEIMCRCGDVVHIDSDYGIPLPAISIVPFRGGYTWVDYEKVTIEAAGGGKYNVKFAIPDGFLEQIRRFTQHGDEEDLPYIISSETSSRSLRVFFPKKEIEPRILHVGFVHLDMPGALSAITGVLAKSGFNILTGLLRKTSWKESGYEVVLEYKNDDPPPQVATAGYAEVFSWVKEKIEACNAEEIAELERFKVSIEPPLYPKPSPAVSPLRLNLTPSHVSPKASAGSEDEKQKEFLERCFQAVVSIPIPRPELDEVRINLLRDVKYRLSTRKPVLFLSYPTAAKDHAELLKSRLEKRFPNHFEITDYQTSDFQVVVESVKDRIRRCDYFIGIWHHEELLGHHEATISPWMPFEYGIALQADKKAIVIHSDKLPQAIWKRIDPGISQPSYNDLTFLKEMVGKVLEFCGTHWVQVDKDSSDG
jgi:predicted amino acid-binding ACT domain protein